MTGSAAEVLLRWEAGGAQWRVLSRGPGGAVVALLTCTGGEEVDRLVSDEPDLLALLDERG